VGTFAAANGLDPEALVLGGGEEYVVVGTLREADLDAASGAVRKAGGRLIPIGSATGKRGTVVLREKGMARTIKDEGWTHLR